MLAVVVILSVIVVTGAARAQQPPAPAQAPAPRPSYGTDITLGAAKKAATASGVTSEQDEQVAKAGVDA